MKIYFLLLTLCSTFLVQAQRMHLDSLQTQLWATDEGGIEGVYINKQHYDEAKRTLIKENTVMTMNPYIRKSVFKYDKDGRNILYETYDRRKSDEKWEKYQKETYKFGKDKKTTSVYTSFKNKWVKERKEELYKKGNYYYYIVYNCPEGSRWQPDSKETYLENEKGNKIERITYNRAQKAKDWQPEEKIKTIYKNDTIVQGEVKALWENGKWTDNAKYEYGKDSIVGDYSVYYELLGGKWQPKERNCQKMSISPKKITSLKQRWNEKEQKWDDFFLAEEKYNENYRIESYIKRQWNTNKGGFEQVEAQNYKYDEDGKLLEHAITYNEETKEKVKATYQYDNEGNRTIAATYEYNTKADKWDEVDRTVYTYDTAIERKSVVDEGGIAMLDFSSKNAVLTATYYRKNKKQYEVRYFYSTMKK